MKKLLATLTLATLALATAAFSTLGGAADAQPYPGAGIEPPTVLIDDTVTIDVAPPTLVAPPLLVEEIIKIDVADEFGCVGAPAPFQSKAELKGVIITAGGLNNPQPFC